MTSFVHLRVHSEYSIVDGMVRIKPLAQAVAKNNMFAVAVTDQCNLFSVVKFYKAAIAAGIKPIIGADIWLKNPEQNKQPWRLTLLCQNNEGYQNLIRLISHSYLHGQTANGIAVIEKEWLNNYANGLIALSGAREGDVGQALLAGNKLLAEQLTNEWLGLFPNRYYLELQRTGRSDEEAYLKHAITLALEKQIPVVATNDVRFLQRDDFEAHEARVAINEGMTLADPRRVRRYSDQQYLRSADEMAKLFKDIPEALENTVEIAKRCNVTLNLGKNFLPKFPIPANTTLEKYFAEKSNEGLNRRLQELNITERTAYDERLKLELTVINNMGFAGYFLIVADFIAWSKSNNIPVGPGRGSGAGSLVAFALRITDIDPLPYDLLFERFLNPERISMPDFDIDFCMDGRDRVIEYVTEKYGQESVAQIITYGTMAAKAVVRDVGRVFGHPYGFVDKIAKLIPFELGMTLDKALEQEDELRKRYNDEEEVRTLLDLAKKLEGITRNAGKHAGGVVISPSLLTDFTPIYCEPGGTHPVSQFDKDDVEAVGLVKFDFLGLRTLTIIAMAVENINQQRQKNNEPLLNITQLPLDDKKTFDLIKACSTTAIFQLESRGMKDLIKRLQPDCFEDIVALVALFRPGPLQSGMVDDFVERKNGRSKTQYPHPLVEPILRTTYGIILYQEQVMQIAQVLAGYTLGSADLLRKAMGKKKPEEMVKQRAIFTAGSVARGVKAETATGIFDLMEKFAGYGFNKSHSAAYAMVSYQTAWLKAHYPAEFMAAVLSSDMDNTDKVVSFLDECRRMQLPIISPDINRSQYRFTVTPQNEILYGLGAIKGSGENAINNILEARTKNGEFKDLFSFCAQIDTRKVNRRVLEALVKSGAFDHFGKHRALLFASLDKAVQSAEQQSSAKSRGQVDLFGEAKHEDIVYVTCEEWTTEQRLQGEKETLGCYFSGHPLQAYDNELNKIATISLADLSNTRQKNVIVAGLIVAVKTIFTKRGDRIAFVTLEDKNTRVELTVFSELYEKHKALLVADEILIAEGEIGIDDFTGNHRLMTRTLYSLDQARENFAKYLLLNLHADQLQPKDIEHLEEILTPSTPGNCPIYIQYQVDNTVAKLVLGDSWKVRLNDSLLNGLRRWLGENKVSVCY